MGSEATLAPDSPNALGLGSLSRAKPDGGTETTPPSSDTRYILTEITKLTVKVDRLVGDVDGLASKVDTLRGQVRFVQGAAWIIGILVVIVGPIAGLIASGKLTIGFH